MISVRTLSIALLLGASALASPLPQPALLGGALDGVTGLVAGGATEGAATTGGPVTNGAANTVDGTATNGVAAAGGPGDVIVGPNGNNGQYGQDGQYGNDGQYGQGQYWNGQGWQYNDCDSCEYHDNNDYDWRHGQECYSREETYRHRESISRGDYSECPDYFREEEWSRFVEECYDACNDYDYDSGSDCDECDSYYSDSDSDCDECDNDYDWRHGEVCYTKEETYRYRESISRGDYSECPDYFKEEEWSRFVEECYQECESDDYYKRDYDECDECDDDNDYDWRHGKQCYSREEAYSHVESISRNDYSDCPDEFKHEEWKKFVEECYYNQDDDECDECDYDY